MAAQACGLFSKNFSFLYLPSSFLSRADTSLGAELFGLRESIRFREALAGFCQI
jgi:hypothetical protein